MSDFQIPERVVVVDMETYWAIDYTLRKNKHCDLSTTQYIRDKRFHAHGCGVAVDGDEPVWVPHDALPKYLKRLPRKNTGWLAHHAHFDGLILSHHYDVHPEFWFDSLSMGRARFGMRSRADLDSLGKYLGVGGKLEGYLEGTKGLRVLPPEIEQKLAAGCVTDALRCRQMFELMRSQFTDEELFLISVTVKMYTEPSFVRDRKLLRRVVREERATKRELMDLAGVDEEVLQSADKLAAELERRGVKPPEKWSVKQEDWTYAFAQTDLEFVALTTHEDPEVANLIRARLAVKSTLAEKRAERVLASGDPFPIYLNYALAHTTRWSGGDKTNAQNFTRPDPDNYENTGLLRKSLKARRGHKIVIKDQAQIEARVLAWIAGEKELLEGFRDPTRDMYKELASVVYSKPIEEITKSERFIGKVGRLGLGFNMGGPKLQYTLAIGVMGPPVMLELHECYRVVDIYRGMHTYIVAFWALCEDFLKLMMTLADGESVEYGPLIIKNREIVLPSGLSLFYPDLQIEYDEKNDRSSYIYFEKGKKKYIYGGLLCENIVQALARCIIAHQMALIGQRFKVVMMSHDEIACMVKTQLAKRCSSFMDKVMLTPPSWAPDLPLGVEGGIYDRYAK